MAEPPTPVGFQQMEDVVHARLAPVLVGTLASNVLYGIVVCLAYHYFSQFPKDRLAFKLLVAYLMVVATVDTVLNNEWTVSWGVDSFGQWIRLTSMPWQFAAFIVVTSTAVCPVQLFYGWRVWVVSQRENRILVGAIGTLTCAMFDLLITIGMVYYLAIRPRHDNAGVLRTSSRLSQLVILSCKTNLLSALLQIVILALALSDKRSMNFMYVDLWIGKAYIACAIVTLNARAPPAPILPTSTTAVADDAVPSFDRASSHAPTSPARCTGQGLDLLGFLCGRGTLRAGPGAGAGRDSAVQVTVARLVVQDENKDEDDEPAVSAAAALSSLSSSLEKPSRQGPARETDAELARRVRIAPFASEREVRAAVAAERRGFAGGLGDYDVETTVGGGLWAAGCTGTGRAVLLSR
ncbi:hypothetical protein JCM3770_002420 [Rhodotorula araucariae]